MTTMLIKADEQTKKWAQDAQMVQSGCNPVGIANTMVRIMTELTHAEDGGTDLAGNHPVVIAFLDKLSSLGSVQNFANDRIMDAHAACDKLAEGEDVEWEITR